MLIHRSTTSQLGEGGIDAHGDISVIRATYVYTATLRPRRIHVRPCMTRPFSSANHHLSSRYSEKIRKTGRRKSRRKIFPASVQATGQSEIPRTHIRNQTLDRYRCPEPSRGTSVCPDFHQHPPPYIALSVFLGPAPGDIEMSEESLVPKKKKYLEFFSDFLHAS